MKKEINESISAYFQRIREIWDKLAAVSVNIDNEELLSIMLKGLPCEYHSFCSVIRTRNDPVAYLYAFLPLEEQSLKQYCLEVDQNGLYLSAQKYIKVDQIVPNGTKWTELTE